MNTQIREYFEEAKVEQAQQYKNLTLIPLVSSYEDGFDYLLLDEALEQETLRVTEIDKDGSVPDLKVINRSGRMVLIFDGGELCHRCTGYVPGRRNKKRERCRGCAVSAAVQGVEKRGT